MTPELELQAAIRNRLVTDLSVTGLVPATAILDRNARPNPSLCIIIGEGQTVDANDSIARDMTRVYMDLHVWKVEPSTIGVKSIAGAIRNSLRNARMRLALPFHCVDCHVSAMRFLRDPDGATSHAVVTVKAIVQVLA